MSEITGLGRVVHDMTIRTEETEPSGAWVGSDIVLEVLPPARYAVRVVTKQRLVSESIKMAFAVDDALHDTLSGLDDSTVEKLPFVVNHDEITEELLRTEFIGRVIAEDLAQCLYELPD